MAPSSTPSSSGGSTPMHGSTAAPTTNGHGSSNPVAAANPADPLGAAAPAGAGGLGADGKPAAHISPANSLQLHQLVTGCKVWVERPAPEEPRKAEILSIRATRQQRPPRNKDGTRPEIPEEQLRPTTEYYVHYVDFNKRLDEWVSATRLLLTQPVEWPVPKEAQAGHGYGHSPAPALKARPSKAADQGLRKTAIKQAASKAGQSRKASSNKKDKKRQKLDPVLTGTLTPSSLHTDEEESSSVMNLDSPPPTRSGSATADRESSTDPATPRDGTPDEDADGEAEGDESTTAEAVISVELMDDAEDVEDEADPDEAAPPNSLQKHATFSKEEEIESLRSHGSMTQSVHEVARVKNLDRIQMGAHEVEAWYFSPYPVEYAHIPILYICEFCLSFYGSPKMLERHRKKCTLLHPPGNEIYRHEDISFYEIDGKKQKTWCRNLCLLSKCFLDHKTLYYDVDPFLYYVMCKRDEFGVHTIGYFSKEKESAENYNLACILTLPQHQRHGYGKLLIEFSYELSKKEGKSGSPEKPLSDLGLLSYRAYWQEIIVDYILEAKGSGRDEVSIDEVAQKTAIVHADIMHTVQTLQMLKFYKNQHVLCLSDALIEQHERIKKKKRRRIFPDALVWRPPVFTKDQLRFGW